eukprot:TRINITY_DN10900_c0_g1_i1.p1 TRINITY_DN10900_c0_g1~~TRINITY_DN10900_c0_g1_i1.p1  ORF type:complete len:144 (-),score=2.19 TRINITY_DN10900_c0_g1_i1:355-786(-)
MIYNFYAFGRGRVLLCREEWNRARPCQDIAEETKYISGLLLTFKSFTQGIGPPKTKGFISYTTPQYKFHAFETPSGYRFVLTTDPSVPDQTECLRQIYSEIFVDCVIKNPLYRLGDDVSNCPVFLAKLHDFIQTRPFFATMST